MFLARNSWKGKALVKEKKKRGSYGFLFSELVKRDFKQKYKRTVLGMIWSVLSPLLDFVVMSWVFGTFFARDMEHYTSYLFSGLVVNSFFQEATNSGMMSFVSNASIISKVKVPKLLFILSKNVSTMINFGLTLIVYFVFLYADGVTLTWRIVLLLYPILCLILLNLSMGLILSTLFVFFKDIQYLYSIFLKLLTYLSAIFYTVDRFPEEIQKLFYFNPIYDIITYFREVAVYGIIPDWNLHLYCIAWPAALALFGLVIYKLNQHKFIYYF